MANGGWHGTREEWDRIEAPLLDIDSVISEFAAKVGLSVQKNQKDWPSRHIEWGSDVRCLIQLYLADQETLTFNLWLCASEDRGNKRYWKQEMPIKQLPVSDFAGSLGAQLQKGHAKLSEWCKNKMQLEFATVIGG
jgi:hypothetical protein